MSLQSIRYLIRGYKNIFSVPRHYGDRDMRSYEDEDEGENEDENNDTDDI